jgi:hypothetical protein
MRGEAPVHYVLVGDGATDRALLPAVSWALRHVHPGGTFGAPTFLARQARPVSELVERAREYQPTLVFVHRDAEGVPRELRLREIPSEARIVPVVPVRMTEAWLLIDEQAIRTAAGNPNGTEPLTLPPLRRLESIPDPKETLRSLLVAASGLGPRRRKRFDRAEAVQRLAEIIENYAALLALDAFRAFHADLVSALAAAGVARDRLRAAPN